MYLGCPMFHRRVTAARVTKLHNTTSTCRTTGAPSPRDETDEESRSCRQNPRAWPPVSLLCKTSTGSLTSAASENCRAAGGAPVACPLVPFLGRSLSGPIPCANRANKFTFTLTPYTTRQRATCGTLCPVRRLTCPPASILLV